MRTWFCGMKISWKHRNESLLTTFGQWSLLSAFVGTLNRGFFCNCGHIIHSIFALLMAVCGIRDQRGGIRDQRPVGIGDHSHGIRDQMENPGSIPRWTCPKRTSNPKIILNPDKLNGTGWILNWPRGSKVLHLIHLPHLRHSKRPCLCAISTIY